MPDPSGAAPWVRPRLAGVLLIAAAAAFILGNAAAIALHPSFDVRAQPFSDLGAVGGLTSLVWSTGILLVGLFTIAAGVAGFGSQRAGVPYELAGIGWVFNSFFDLKSYPDEHGLSALIAFVFSAIIALGSFPRVPRAMGYLGVLSAIVLLIASGLLVTSQGNVSGVFELWIIVPIFGWFLLLGAYLLWGSTRTATGATSVVDLPDGPA